MVVLTPAVVPNVGIRHKQENTTPQVQNESLSSGTLYIAESHVCWIGAEGKGFTLQYPSISLHAISRDTTTFPQPCLYLMVDGSPFEVAGMEEDEEENDPDDSPVTEIRFIPDSSDALDAMFNAMSDCQALHPDEDDSLSDFDEEDEGQGYSMEAGGGDGGMVYTREADVEVLTPQGRATLQHLENLLISSQTPTSNGDVNEPMDAEQFDDADT